MCGLTAGSPATKVARALRPRKAAHKNNFLQIHPNRYSLSTRPDSSDLLNQPPKCLERSPISRSSSRSAVGRTLPPRGSRRTRRPTTSSSRSGARSTCTPWSSRTPTRPRSSSRASLPTCRSPTSPRRTKGDNEAVKSGGRD